jgi:hypothetical protein
MAGTDSGAEIGDEVEVASAGGGGAVRVPKPRAIAGRGSAWSRLRAAVPPPLPPPKDWYWYKRSCAPAARLPLPPAQEAGQAGPALASGPLTVGKQG